MDTATQEKIIKSVLSHKGRLLGNLEEIKCPQAYLELIRQQFFYMVEDIKKEVRGEINGNAKQD